MERNIEATVNSAKMQLTTMEKVNNGKWKGKFKTINDDKNTMIMTMKRVNHGKWKGRLLS